MNAQKEFLENFWVQSSYRKPTKVCDEMKETGKEEKARHNVVDGWREFMGCVTQVEDSDKMKVLFV